MAGLKDAPRIPRADIEAARDDATRNVVEAMAFAGIRPEDTAKLVEAVDSVPINPELVPQGVVMYMLLLKNAVERALPGYAHMVGFLLLPYRLELGKLPGVEVEVTRLRDGSKAMGEMLK